MHVLVLAAGRSLIIRAFGPIVQGVEKEPLIAAVGRRPSPGIGNLVLDLAMVPYVDAFGVGVLVEANAEAQRNGTRLTVVGLRPKVRYVLGLCGLVGRLPLAEAPDITRPAPRPVETSAAPRRRRSSGSAPAPRRSLVAALSWR